MKYLLTILSLMATLSGTAQTQPAMRLFYNQKAQYFEESLPAEIQNVNGSNMRVDGRDMGGLWEG